jgi:hypothetical protein
MCRVLARSAAVKESGAFTRSAAVAGLLQMSFYGQIVVLGLFFQQIPGARRPRCRPVVPADDRFDRAGHARHTPPGQPTAADANHHPPSATCVPRRRLERPTPLFELIFGGRERSRASWRSGAGSRYRHRCRSAAGPVRPSTRDCVRWCRAERADLQRARVRPAYCGEVIHQGTAEALPVPCGALCTICLLRAPLPCPPPEPPAGDWCSARYMRRRVPSRRSPIRWKDHQRLGIGQ